MTDAKFAGVLVPSDAAWMLYCEAEAVVEAEPSRAIATYERAVVLADGVGSRYVAAINRVSLAAAAARTGDPASAKSRFREVLENFRRAGNVTHAVTTLRNLIPLLVGQHDDEVAMKLLGALTGDEVKSTYGQEAQQIDACQQTVIGRVGASRVDEWLAAGSGRGESWAISFALDHL